MSRVSYQYLSRAHERLEALLDRVANPDGIHLVAYAEYVMAR
jgi:hypothetical protein